MTAKGARAPRRGMGPAEFARGVKVIFLRETEALFDSSIAYIYLIVFTATAAGIFMNDFFLRAVADMTPYFRMLPTLALLFVPALTMRIWAEERRAMTFEMIVTLPLHPFQLVIGKYLALFVFYLLSLAGSAPVAFMLTSLGDPDLGTIVSGYLGAAALGAAFIAAGAFVSGLTANQIVAFIGTSFLCFLFVFSGNETVTAVLDGLSPTLQMGTFLYESISVAPRYEAMLRGAVSAADAFYFLALTALFLWLNGVSVRQSSA